MKMLKNFFAASFILACFCLFTISCSGGDGSTADSSSGGDDGLTAETKINGPLGTFFEVVDKNYKIMGDESTPIISVQIKRISEGGPKGFSWSSKSKPGFKLEVFDSDDDLICSDKTDVVYEEDQLKAIFDLGVGETATLSFKFFLGKENLKNLRKAHKLKISSVWDADKEDNSSISEDVELGDQQDAASESSFDVSKVLLPSQLKGKVEVVSAEKSVGSYGYPTMDITFKLLSKVNTSSMCSQYGQMWIVGVGQTESGVDVKELLPNYREWRSGDSDGNEFKSFLEGDPGETITLEFTGDNESSDDVEKDLEKVKKFKLKITK